MQPGELQVSDDPVLGDRIFTFEQPAPRLGIVRRMWRAYVKLWRRDWRWLTRGGRQLWRRVLRVPG